MAIRLQSGVGEINVAAEPQRKAHTSCVFKRARTGRPDVTWAAAKSAKASHGISGLLVRAKRTRLDSCFVRELVLLADFGESFFPIAFVRERVGIRSPKFFHHLALRHERTF